MTFDEKTFDEIAKQPIEQFHFNREHWCRVSDVKDQVSQLVFAHKKEIIKLDTEHKKALTDAIIKAVAPYSNERDMRDDRIMEAMELLDKATELTGKVRELIDHPSGYVSRRLPSKDVPLEEPKPFGDVPVENIGLRAYRITEDTTVPVDGEKATRPIVKKMSSLDFAMAYAKSALETYSWAKVEVVPIDEPIFEYTVTISRKEPND